MEEVKDVRCVYEDAQSVSGGGMFPRPTFFSYLLACFASLFGSSGNPFYRGPTCYSWPVMSAAPA